MDKVVYIHRKGENGELEELNKMLENGWKMIQMSTVSEQETYGCYVWIKKDDEYPI